jgi:hypothetical protein
LPKTATSRLYPPISMPYRHPNIATYDHAFYHNIQG